MEFWVPTPHIWPWFGHGVKWKTSSHQFLSFCWQVSLAQCWFSWQFLWDQGLTLWNWEANVMWQQAIPFQLLTRWGIGAPVKYHRIQILLSVAKLVASTISQLTAVIWQSQPRVSVYGSCDFTLNSFLVLETEPRSMCVLNAWAPIRRLLWLYPCSLI